jgi:hypothetical protein
MLRLRSTPPKKVQTKEPKAKATEAKAKDGKQPAYLTENPFDYVPAVLERQSTTVAALVEAGLNEGAIGHHCLMAVIYVRELPQRIEHEKALAKQAVAALPALNTVRTLVDQLFLIHGNRWQTSGSTLIKSWDKKEIVAVLDYLEQEATRHQKANTEKHGIAPQAGQKDLRARRWSAVRTAIGLLAFVVRQGTGSANTALVANLCNELFPGAAPDTRNHPGRSVDEEIVRRCLKQYDPAFEFELYFGRV